MSDSGLRLFVDPSVDNATVKLEWCCSPELMQRLRRCGGTDGCETAADYDRFDKLFLLISCIDARGNEQRQLVPLRQGMEFVPLRTSGVNRCFAVVIRDYSEETEREALNRAKDKWLRRDGFEYRAQLLRADREAVYEDLVWRSSRIDIDVPKEAFGRPLTGWLRRWTFLFNHSRRPDDQCGQRRWLIFAFTLQPILMLAYSLLIELMLAVLSTATFCFGVIGLRYRSLLRPWSRRERSLFFNDSERTARCFWFSSTRWPLALLTPLVLFILTMMSFSDQKLFDGQFSAIPASVILTVVAISYAVQQLIQRNNSAASRITRKVLLASGRGSWKALVAVVTFVLLPWMLFTEWLDRRYAARLDDVVCIEPPESCAPQLKPRNQTIRLRLKALKQKVCRPIESGYYE